MGIQRRVALAGTAAAAALLVSGFGAVASADGQYPAAQSSPSADTSAGPKVVKAVYNPQLGMVAANGEGRTIYRFDKDTAYPSNSNCYDECAVKWPPVKFRHDAWYYGIDRKNVSYIQRRDGSYQLTLGGWPMYYFFKDTQPFQTNGQGVEGVWFVSAPDGSKARLPEHSTQPGY